MPTIPSAAGRRAALTAVMAAVAGLIAACGSASAPGPASSPAGTASSHQAQPGAGSASSATSMPTVPGMNGLAVCQPAALKVTVDTSQAGGAAGSTYYPVNFTNTSSSPCGMYGFPGVSFATAAGQQIGAAAQRNPAFGDVAVRLDAGGVAHAWLQVAQAANYPSSTCQPVTASMLRVYPPGDTGAAYVNQSFPACASAGAPLLTVMPVRAGKGMQGTTP